MVTIKALPIAIGAGGSMQLPDRMAAYRLGAEAASTSSVFPLVLASDAYAGATGIVELSATDITGFRLSDQCPWRGVYWKSHDHRPMPKPHAIVLGSDGLVLLLDEFAHGQVSIEEFEHRITIEPGEEEGSGGSEDGGALEHVRAGPGGTDDGGAMDKTIMGQESGDFSTEDGGPQDRTPPRGIDL